MMSASKLSTNQIREIFPERNTIGQSAHPRKAGKLAGRENLTYDRHRSLQEALARELEKGTAGELKALRAVATGCSIDELVIYGFTGNQRYMLADHQMLPQYYYIGLKSQGATGRT